MAAAAHHPRPRPGPGAALAAGWLVAVAGIAVLQRTAGAPSAASLACSPERLSHGAVWTLATSAFVIAGPPVGQLAMTALLTVLVLERVGGRGFWIVAVAGHVGATLAAYAGIGALWLVGGARFEHLVDAPDFGISAVWAALLGAMSVAGWRLGRARQRLAAAALGVLALAAFAVLVPLDGELSDVEHLLAFLAGLAAAAWIAVPSRPNRALIRREGGTPTLKSHRDPPLLHEDPDPCRAP